MREYAKTLIKNQVAMCAENNKNPERKLYSWDEFWQMYNKFWNLKRYEAVLLHVRMNYLNGFSRGKF